MFSSIFSFEIRRLVKSPATYVYFFILLSLSFLLALMAGGTWPQLKFAFGGEKILANAPIIVDAFYGAISSYIGIIIIVAVVGNAVLKDFRSNTYTMIFTTPVSKFNYLFGRFSASMLVSILLLTAPAIGLMLGYATPWVNPDRIGAFSMVPYINSYLQTIIPNALLYGAIFFSVSLIARDIFVIWLSLIVFFVATGVSNSLFSSLDKQTISALADPMGNFAKRTLSKYWSTYHKNHLHYSLSGLFLANRLLWLGISAIVWGIGYSLFSFSSSPRRLLFGKPRLTDSAKATFVPVFFNRGMLPCVAQEFTSRAHLRSLWGLSVNECRTLWRNTYFRIIMLFGMLFLFLAAMQIGKIYDTTVFPVTSEVVEYFSGTFQLFIVILTIMFAGEQVWRAREHRISNILDALPVPNWVFYVSKLSGLFFMQALLLGVVMLCGIVVQLSKGYTQLDLPLYLQMLFGIRLIDLWLLAVLAVFVQALVSNKFVGHFIVAIFYFWNGSFASLVLKHNLFIFSSDPGTTYSAMNGFGHTLYPYFVFKLYWAGFSIMLAGFTSMLWPRGSEGTLRQRWALAKAGKQGWGLVVAGLALFVATGGFIYYNTNVLNEHLSDFEQEKEQADYEKAYRKFLKSPQPRIAGVQLSVDIFPDTRSLKAKGQYILKNNTLVAIDSVHIMLQPTVKLSDMQFTGGATMAVHDSVMGYRIYRLAKPLQPGDSLIMTFQVALEPKGFTHDFAGLSTPLYNGTFVNNRQFLPSIGYNPDYELSNNSDRKKHGLAYRATANAISDTTAYHRNVFTQDADFVSFDVTVSTVPDQIAVAPGYLQREWVEGGRRYFHYKMDNPILNFYSFLSARYKVKKETWQGTSLEIYYQEGHEYNLARMMNGIKKSLAYYTANFSPYQHRQVRILEFPRYSTFAQSFPNTIPFSEGIGFIADVDDSSKEDVDYPFYVTAHEVAHQWFAHQVTGADVEGSNLLSESLAQYGAIMVLEREYGEERMRKFLKLEMDKYLVARSSESEKEKPWAFADAGQAYVLYQKGGILMHAFNKYMGEDSLNHALARFIGRFAFRSDPYPKSTDLVGYLRQSTPDSLQYFITDAFERITIYDNKVTSVNAEKTDSNYTITAVVEAEKLYADSTGKETRSLAANYVELGVFKNKATLQHLARYKLKPGKNSITFTVQEPPYKVAIDPRLLLIDKKLDDNEQRIEQKWAKDKKVARK